jgi:hypothetical protein
MDAKQPFAAHWPGSMLVMRCLIVVVACQSVVAHGQNAPWGWAPADHATAVWTPQNLADYLMTGHTPHPAVARIVAPEQSSTSLGSGVLVDVNRNQGLVLTNWHVVRESKSAVLVQFADGFQSAGTVVRWDEAWDLAALVIWKPNATPVRLAETPPAVGDMLTIAGFGRGPYREEAGPCTEYLSPGTGYPNEFVELRARARQGDSGGPIFNDRGELAGVLFGESDGRTIGSCSTRVKTFLAAVGSRGFVSTPIAEFSDTPAIARGIGHAARHEVIANAGELPIRRSAQGESAPTRSPALDPAPGGPFHTETSRNASPTTASHWLGGWTSDAPRRPDFLAAAGGVALVILGIRMLFRGRRVPPG